MAAPIHILVLEDDPTLRETLADVLEDQGYRVTAVGRGLEAVEKAREMAFDLIVADIRMEGIDGLEAIEKAREVRPGLGALVVSGYASDEEVARADRLQVDGYLKKPVRMQDFLERVRALVAHKVHREESQRAGTDWRTAFTWAVEALAEMSERAGLAPSGSLRSAAERAQALARETSRTPDVAEELRLAALLAPLQEHIPIPELGPLLPAGARALLEGTEESELVKVARHGLGERTGALAEAWQRVQANPPKAPEGGQCRIERSLLSLAVTLERSGDRVSAARAFEQIAERSEPRPELAQAFLGRARLEPSEAARWAREAAAVARHLGPVAGAQVGLESALTLWRAGDPEAREALVQAAAVNESLGLRVGAALARTALSSLTREPFDLAVLADPRHAGEVAGASNWLLKTLLDLKAFGPLVKLAADFPQELVKALQRAPQPLREGLVKHLEGAGSYLPEAVLAQLAEDPEPDLRNRALRLRGGAETPPLVRVCSLGRLTVHRGEETITDGQWKTAKVKLLFARLASQWGRPVHEELLLEDLWPDDLVKGKKNLYWASSIVRSCLKGGAELVREGETLRLLAELPRWHDIEELERSARGGQEAEEAGQRRHAMAEYRRLNLLYQGPYLEGCYHDWALLRRERLEELTCEGLQRLAELSYEDGLHGESLEAARAILALQPQRQEAHLAAMRAYLGLSQPEKALDQFKVCETLLRKEYGLEPQTALLEYYHRAKLAL